MTGRAFPPRRKSSRPPRRALLHVAAILGLLAVLSTGIFLWLNKQAQAVIGGPFRLLDDSGHTVTNRDFRGKYRLIYFGYTHCKDICPTTLHDIAGALRDLGTKGGKIQPIFITIDPRRDTVAALHRYVAAISPRLIGLTGSADQIRRVEREFHVYAHQESIPSHPSEYGMDHSVLLYLVGPDGRTVAPISSPSSARGLATQILGLIR